MARAVRFERYGGAEVLDVVDVEPPELGDGQLLVRVRAAGINPFEAKLRSGAFEGSIPLRFPAAQGNDFAGVVEEIGADVEDFRVGDEILGTTAVRGSQAELAVASQGRVVARPAALPWEVAGGLWNIATTAYASVAATGAGEADVVLVTGASGGVGGLAAQLALHRGATVVGIAGERSHAWLRSRGIVPVAYGDGLQERLERAVAETGGRLDALIDAVGQGYVEIGLELGVAPERINTVVDYDAAARHGVRTDGAREAANTEVVEEIVQLLLAGVIELPIAASFPLESVREAYELLENGHPPGKIVLIP